MQALERKMLKKGFGGIIWIAWRKHVMRNFPNLSAAPRRYCSSACDTCVALKFRGRLTQDSSRLHVTVLWQQPGRVWGCLWGHWEVSVLVRVSLPVGCPIRSPAAAIPVFWGQIARSLLDREASLTFQVAFLNAICVRHVNYPNTVPDFVHFFCFSPLLGRVEIPNDATWLQPPFLAPYFPQKMPF